MLLACEYCGLIETLAVGGVGLFGCIGTWILSKLHRRRKCRNSQETTHE